MKEDGLTTGECSLQELSRQELYNGYVSCYLHEPRAEVGPCRDACLLKTAAQHLRREPEPGETFKVFPFYEALSEASRDPSTDYRELLTAFIKAAELLETLCVNLFLQPWKKEIKTLKTFTGPFVYCLLPILSSSTIESVLASIGYLPNTDTPLSEYRLSGDVSPDRVMLVGFELLLTRVECYHLLELLGKDQLGPQEWLDVLQRRTGPTKLEKPTEQKTTVGQKEEEEEEKKKTEEALRKDVGQSAEVPLNLDITGEIHQPKPRLPRPHCSVDQSIMEMQKTYPDLAFRGRPLLKLDKGKSSKAVTNTDNHSDDSKTADLVKRASIKGTKAAATTHSKYDGSKANEEFSDNGRSSDCYDRNSGVTTTTTTTGGGSIRSSFSNSEGSRAGDELSGPQAISLHLTLRAGSTAEQSLKPVETQTTTEPSAWTQQQPAADLQNKRPDHPELPSLSSIEEKQELMELAERMGQLHVQDTTEEVQRKDENKRGEKDKNKERKKKERKASTEGEVEGQNLRKPVMETGPALSHAASRSTRSSQSDPAVMTEQKQPSLLNVSTGQEDGEERTETGHREEEQLAQSFVIV